MAAQLVQKDWDVLAKPCSLVPLQAVIQPYMWFSPVVNSFQVLLQRSDDCVSLKQEETFFEAILSWRGPAEIECTARNGHQKSVKLFIVGAIKCLKTRATLFATTHIFTLHEKWPELNSFTFQIDCLPLLSATLLESATSNLNIGRPRQPLTEVAERYEHHDVVVRFDSDPPLTSSYINRSLLSSAADCDEPKLNMTRYRFEKNRTTYVQKSLKKRKMVKN